VLKKMKIVFIQTGGTIDKDYPHTTKGWAFEFGEPATNRIIEKLDPSFEFEVVTSCQKDSLDITDQDRKNLADLINSHGGKKFIITHGTDTMMETATYLDKKVGDKLVVITGAMRPERFSNSEAPINLGCAIAAANLIEKGVYIAMHGIVKAHSKIKRDLETGKYY
jgi:L-asparaginase